jgi:hypothetical protein
MRSHEIVGEDWRNNDRRRRVERDQEMLIAPEIVPWRRNERERCDLQCGPAKVARESGVTTRCAMEVNDQNKMSTTNTSPEKRGLGREASYLDYLAVCCVTSLLLCACGRDLNAVLLLENTGTTANHKMYYGYI